MGVLTPEPGEGDEERRRKVAEENARARHPHQASKAHEKLPEPVEVPVDLASAVESLFENLFDEYDD